MNVSELFPDQLSRTSRTSSSRAANPARHWTAMSRAMRPNALTDSGSIDSDGSSPAILDPSSSDSGASPSNRRRRPKSRDRDWLSPGARVEKCTPETVLKRALRTVGSKV